MFMDDKDIKLSQLKYKMIKLVILFQSFTGTCKPLKEWIKPDRKPQEEVSNVLYHLSYQGREDTVIMLNNF